MEKLKLILLRGMQNGTLALENSLVVLQKFKLNYREVGGGFRIGNSCTPVADSCQCMAKPIQYCKAK